MAKRLVSSLLSLMLLTSVPALAMEQTFTQGAMKATVKLTPDDLRVNQPVTLTLHLQRDGAPVTGPPVMLEVWPKDAKEPDIKRPVDVLDGDYVDTWTFDKPGDYRVAVTIASSEKAEGLRYETMASVADRSSDQHRGHEGHGFFAHHFGWWGGGLMILMMVTMMVLL